MPQTDSLLPVGQAIAATHPAVALCVVTNFKLLRRQLGQERWQTCMSALVSHLQIVVRSTAVVQIAPDCIQLNLCAESVESLRHTLEAVITNCAAFFEEGDPSTSLSMAVGAALATDGCEQLVLVEQAESALADACRGGGLVVVTAKRDPQTFEEISLLRDLPVAVAREEFFLLYQPKIHVRERRVSSAEALIRWLHPRHGLIMPDSFIGLADESGDILEIALWTLRRVIADQRALADQGHPLCIFVNISGRLLTDNGFIDDACELVRTSGAQIGFEITETSVIHDPDLAIANLERCAAIGITLAIDDYGSGLSSLSYLKRLPASELKIDKQFVTQLTSSHRDPLIVRSTIDLAHALDMEVTAEGVETPAALALLTVMGCEMVQGYLISAPLRLDAFTTYLEDYHFETLQADTAPTVIRPASFWKSA